MTHDEMDDQIYDSCKASFEHIMFSMIDKVKDGKSYHDSVIVLLDSYSNMCDNAKNLSKRLCAERSG